MTIVLMGGLLAFVLVFKGAFSSGIANFMSQVTPASSDLEIPAPEGTGDGSRPPQGSQDD
jgi:hypothetical protein